MKLEAILLLLAMTSSAGRASSEDSALPHATIQEIHTSRLPFGEAATPCSFYECQRKPHQQNSMAPSSNLAVNSLPDMKRIPPTTTTFQDLTEGRDVINKNSYITQSTYNYPNERQPSPAVETNSTNNDVDNLQPRSKGYGYGHYHQHKPNSYYDKAPAPPFQAKFSFDFPVDKYKSYRVFKILSMNATLDNFKSLHKPILQFGFASGMEPIYHKKSHHHHHKAHHQPHSHHHLKDYNEGPLKSHNYQVFHSHGPTSEYHQQNPDPIYYHQVSDPSFNKNPDPLYHHQLSNPSHNKNYQYSVLNQGQEGFGPPKPEDLKLNEYYRSIDSDKLQVPFSGNRPQHNTQYSGVRQSNMNLDLSKGDFINYEPYAMSKYPSTDDSNEDSSTFWDFFPKIDFESGDKSTESYDENTPFSGLKNLASLFSNIFKKNNNEKEQKPLIHLYPFPEFPREENKDNFWPPLPAQQLEAPLNKYWFIPTEPSKRENVTKGLARELPNKNTKSSAWALPGLSQIPLTLWNQDSKIFERNSSKKLLNHQPTAFKTSARDPLYHGIGTDGKLKSSHFIYDDLQTYSQNSPISRSTTSKPWVWRNLKNGNSSQRYILPRKRNKLPKILTKEKPIQDKVETTNDVKENTPSRETDLIEMDWMVDNQSRLPVNMKESPIQVISPPDLTVINLPEKNNVANLTKELTDTEMPKDKSLTHKTDFSKKKSIIENQTNEFIQMVSSPDLTVMKFSHENKSSNNYSREIIKGKESIDGTLAKEDDLIEIKDSIIETHPTKSEFMKYKQVTTAVTSRDVVEDKSERNVSLKNYIAHIPKERKLQNNNLLMDSEFVEVSAVTNGHQNMTASNNKKDSDPEILSQGVTVSLSDGEVDSIE